jgi:hypothetical protein
LSAEQVAERRGSYDPMWHYENDPETREALDLICSGHFSPGEADIFAPIRERLLDQGDYFTHLADLPYADARHAPRGYTPIRRDGRRRQSGTSYLGPLLERSNDRGARGRDLKTEPCPVP